jgi:hypothetical protein
LLLLSCLASNGTRSVVQKLCSLNADLAMRTTVEMHAIDPSTISRILDDCHELINTGQLSFGLLVEGFKLVRETSMRVNPRLMSAVASAQSQLEAGSEYVDEEANSYF